jgi:pSer/pThr/pTyr-binding forkhead associated (FHA) protein
MNVTAIEGPHLHVVSGSRAGLNSKLTVGQSGKTEWTIGSEPDREVVFQDSGVSSLHAKIVNEGGRWQVLDQMSAHGTFVNGKRVNVSYLSEGDRVRFGPVECVFQISRAAAAPRRLSGASVGSGQSASKGKTLLIGAIAFVVTIAVLFLVYEFVL